MERSSRFQESETLRHISGVTWRHLSSKTLQSPSKLVTLLRKSACFNVPKPKKSMGDASGELTGISLLGIIVIPNSYFNSAAYWVVIRAV